MTWFWDRFQRGESLFSRTYKKGDPETLPVAGFTVPRDWYCEAIEERDHLLKQRDAIAKERDELTDEITRLKRATPDALSNVNSVLSETNQQLLQQLAALQQQQAMLTTTTPATVKPAARRKPKPQS